MELEKKKEFARKFIEFMRDFNKYSLVITKKDFEFKVLVKVLVNKFQDRKEICFVLKEKSDFKKIFNNQDVNVIIGAPYSIGNHIIYIYDLNTFIANANERRFDIIVVDGTEELNNKTVDRINNLNTMNSSNKIIFVNYSHSKIPSNISKLVPLNIDLIGEGTGYLSNIIKSINRLKY